jgi:preprotein translocase subunit SecG
MITFITVVHIFTVVLLVVAVLLQSGKGAEISATFGGSSQTVFGSSGGQNFFQKLTYALAGIFMCTSLILTILPSKLKRSVLDGYTPPAAPASAPAAPAAGSTAPAQNQQAPTAPTENKK